MNQASDSTAISVLGRDYAFPKKVEGLPAALSEFPALQIRSFVTSDGVRLTYWEAGEGDPLIFVPGWASNGAEYINLLYLLRKNYRVIVLDPRNQGLSERTERGPRIARLSMDLKELGDNLGLRSAYYCGWSMGASILWSYIDLFGSKTIRKAVFVDQPISIYSHADWPEQERSEAGGLTTSPERMVAAFTQGQPTNSLYVDMNALERYAIEDSPAYVNSKRFASKFISNDRHYLSLVLFNHAVSDWRDVIRHKVDVPTAIFTGEFSNNVPSQRWMHAVIPGSTLHIYSRDEHGDHFLMFKNPWKFSRDLCGFLES
jgi:pimeloyl-ACP methyl ester carboxylesterase